MTTTNTYSRQPSKLDYASPTQFKFSIFKLPKVEYFCSAVNLPSITINTTIQQTPLKDIPIPGEKIAYEDLTMTFLVDENLENYQEIHGWIVGLGFPKERSQYRALAGAGNDRFPTTDGANRQTDAGRQVYGATDQGGILSDATLSILSSKNNPAVEVRFQDVFPVSLSGLSYNQQATDVDYLTADVTFKYKLYEFASSVGSSTTTTITS